MQLHRVALSETNAFSTFFTDYIEQKEQLKPFYGLFPTPGNFKAQIEAKESSFKNREVLHNALVRQYGKLKTSKAVSSNIDALRDSKTFTITTGHQLNIFTGPLFFIYKIVAVINACKQLKQRYPEYNFVPVFWMASEDHDYDEIKSFRLYGKKYTWETDQTGAVGRFDPKSIEKILGDIPGDITIFRDAYKSATLAEACRYYVNEIFSKEGLVIIDGDDASLKSLFKPMIREDVLKQTPKALVEEKNEELKSLGYHTQVFARDINFFYLDNGVRGRLEKTDSGFTVVDTDLRFSQKAIEDLIESNPEKFSPNVILRPVYQEVILPNLAYVGGPAEMIYWLQLKGIFDHFKIPFPVLLPRCFALYIEKQQIEKWYKTGLEIEDLFKEKNYLFNHWTLKNTHHKLTLGEEMKIFKKIMDEISGRAAKIDSTLVPMVAAQSTRVSSALEKIEHKMLRAEKRLHREKLGQIEAVKDVLFPNGGLQERTDNYLSFAQKDPVWVSKMIDVLDPFDLRFNVICDD